MSYLKYFLTSALLPILFFFGLGVFLQPLQGDLTRLGNLAERDFGWNATQPVLPLRGNQPTNPGVIVLGDSFSRWNVWQSASMKSGSPDMLTFHWDGFDSSECPDDWITSLKETYPSARFLVIEVVEREFLRRFGPTETRCHSQQQKPVEVSQGSTTPPLRLLRSFDFANDLPDTIYAMHALHNSFRFFDKTTLSANVFVTPLIRSNLFSNHRSDLMVYYKDDELIKKDWTPEDIRKAVTHVKNLQLSAAAHGLTMITAIVPDKSTTYRKFMRQPQAGSIPDVWKELSKQGVTQVNLRGVLDNAADTVTDLYLPNDTHLGTAGFMLMGEAIARKIK